MKLLMIGPEYQQIALKTERAAEQLRWISADVLSPEEVAGYRSAVAAEEDAYQMLFARKLEEITGGSSDSQDDITGIL